MRIRAAEKGGITEVKALMSHLMETGQRKDEEGNVIPAHFIQEVTVVCNDRTVLKAQWGPAVSRDPFLSFKFEGAGKGDEVTITWLDNEGESRSDTTKVR